ncbi:MAG: helix-turn-helix transcriptional regulator [Acidobacteriota bacterium]
MAADASASPLASLSPRELQIVHLICTGHTSTQIAQILKISKKTVWVHRKNVYRKLGVHGVVGLVKWAMENHITETKERKL